MLRGFIERLRYANLKQRQQPSVLGGGSPGFGDKSGGVPYPLQDSLSLQEVVSGAPRWVVFNDRGKVTVGAVEAVADLFAHAARAKAEWVRFNSAQLEALPVSVGGLEHLRTLELKNNALEELPNAVGNLSRLEVLALSGNRLRTLPAAIGNLTHLMILGLSSNWIQRLPEQIGELRCLRELHLGGNKLETIPPSVGRLKELIKLNLNDNELRELPRSLLECTKLRELYLHENPRLGIPEDLLGPSWEDVFSGGAHPASAREVLNWYFSRRR